MLDDINPSSPVPLYDQIATRVRVAVAAGDLKPGEALPSVRQLASTLRINPATVAQAYRTLEADGFVEMRQGAGTFVRSVERERRAAVQRELAKRLVGDMLGAAGRLGLPRATIVRAFEDAIGVDRS